MKPIIDIDVFVIIIAKHKDLFNLMFIHFVFLTDAEITDESAWVIPRYGMNKVSYRLIICEKTANADFVISRAVSQ